MIGRVFSAICNDNIHTRREISEMLGVSIVSVGKAVDILIKNGMVSSFGKATSERGRKSEYLDISEDRTVLLINLTEDDFSYSLSPMARDYIEPIKSEYVTSLDFSDNISVLLSRIKSKSRNIPPDKIFVALPGVFENGAIKHSQCIDYSGESISEIFDRYSLSPTGIISCTDAVSLIPTFNRSEDLFVYIGRSQWGSFNGRFLNHISEIPVGGQLRLSYTEALNTHANDARITEYSVRFFTALNAALSPRSIYLHTNRFSKDVIRNISLSIPNVKITDNPSPIFSGLMEHCIAESLKNI